MTPGWLPLVLLTFALLRVASATFVPVFLASTLRPGTAPPDVSVTRPFSVASKLCAQRPAGMARQRKEMQIAEVERVISHSPVPRSFRPRSLWQGGIGAQSRRG